MEVEDEDRIGAIGLYGASCLLDHQAGYSWNPVENTRIDDWPDGLVVIGDDNADPFALDLNRSDGQDAPVLWAMHGMGSWDFEEHSPSFEDFLRYLADTA